MAILGATGRPVLDGEPYQGSLAGFLAEEAALLGHPEVIFCHYDPLAPPLIGATDITAAETRLKEIPGQRYRRLEYAALTTVLPQTLTTAGSDTGRTPPPQPAATGDDTTARQVMTSPRA